MKTNRRHIDATVNLYGYPVGFKKYQLSRDGVVVRVGTEDECWHWLHMNHCYSVHHALKYEGYKMEPVK